MDRSKDNFYGKQEMCNDMKKVEVEIFVRHKAYFALINIMTWSLADRFLHHKIKISNNFNGETHLPLNFIISEFSSAFNEAQHFTG